MPWLAVSESSSEDEEMVVEEEMEGDGCCVPKHVVGEDTLSSVLSEDNMDDEDNEDNDEDTNAEEEVELKVEGEWCTSLDHPLLVWLRALLLRVRSWILPLGGGGGVEDVVRAAFTTASLPSRGWEGLVLLWCSSVKMEEGREEEGDDVEEELVERLLVPLLVVIVVVVSVVVVLVVGIEEEEGKDRSRSSSTFNRS